MNKTITMHDVLEHPQYEAKCTEYLADIRKRCAKALINMSLDQKPGPLLKLYKHNYFNDVTDFTKCVINVMTKRSLLPEAQRHVIKLCFKDIAMSVIAEIIKSENNDEQ